jgi:hypothetical protein
MPDFGSAGLQVPLRMLDCDITQYPAARRQGTISNSPFIIGTGFFRLSSQFPDCFLDFFQYLAGLHELLHAVVIGI